MLKKLFLFVIAFAFASSFALAGPRVTPEQLSKVVRMVNKTHIVGDVVMGTGSSNFGISFPTPYKNVTQGNSPTPLGWITSVTFTGTGALSEYDLISNGSPDIIIQNPNSPDKIHAVCMAAPLGDPSSFPNRRTKYMYSTNRGTSWTFVSNVPNIRSGFATITIMSDGRELVSNHIDPNATGNVSMRFYIDAFEGLGSFTTLDPGDLVHEWPRIVSTNNITNTNKFIGMGSRQSPDSGMYTIGTSLTAPGTFLPWVTPSVPVDPAERYKFARGTDGRIGLAYIIDGTLDATNDGSVYFMESTNNGNTFSAPLKIHNCNFAADSIAGYSGISLCYQGNVPKVVFTAALFGGSSVGYYYNAYQNHIRFWSSSLPGSDPNKSIKIVDTSKVGYHPYLPGASSDGFSTMCQPVIGASGDVLFVAFQTPFGNVNGESFVWAGPNDTISYESVWVMASGNGGLSWKPPVRITPADSSAALIKEWSFPSISPSNDNVTGVNYYANLFIYKDSIPGSYVRHTSNPPSEGQYMFARVNVAGTVFVQNISTEIADKYSLYQNYPNPFNPTTNIRFALPKVSDVTLKIYNINGQLVETLLSGERVSAGTNEIKFNASTLASGIYFYTLQADNYKETKKMMLIK
jgi:hypothetical protein